MIVTFISQCEKNSLKRSRKVLDSFANRIGTRTWQTVITQEGLATVKQLLKQTASKNTAISCHYSGGYKTKKLLWIVGNRNKFNSEGIVPIATTNKTIINTELENSWPYLPLIKSLTAMASLLHDWGKASQYFQLKLQPQGNRNKRVSDPLRHEWVSCLLFTAFIKKQDISDDASWLQAIIDGKLDDSELSLKDEKYLLGIESIEKLNAATIIVWLILTHHRLPFKEDENCLNEKIESVPSIFECITKEWGYAGEDKEIEKCLKLKGYLKKSDKWLKELKKWSAKLKNNLPLLEQAMNNGV